MELLKNFIDIILHLDAHLVELVSRYGTFSYAILFAIIFCETGLVVTPFLPGDSLLFAIGALSAKGALNVYTAAFLLMLAAIIGDSTNYWIGYHVGPKVFRSETSRWLNRAHLERTSAFYAKYGVKTVIIARFMPIIRTFAPFVAGIGRMYYPRFLLFSVLGSFLWIGLFVTAGYLFGNIPVVKRNFTLVVLAIIFVSILPALIEVVRTRRGRREENVRPGSGPIILGRESLTIIGISLGGFIGFLLRPSAPLVGQLDFRTVISRGTNLQGLDQLLAPVAEASFNHLLVGSIIGGVIGFGLGHLTHSIRQRDSV